jgi:hypothetical protein
MYCTQLLLCISTLIYIASLPTPWPLQIVALTTLAQEQTPGFTSQELSKALQLSADHLDKDIEGNGLNRV